MTWNPSTELCDKEPPAAVARQWQTSVAPLVRTSEDWRIYPVDRVVLALRNKHGWPPDDAWEADVTAYVTNPEGNTAALGTYLHSDSWAEVNYPPDAYDMWSGSYTIIWTTNEDEFLACHGFNVEQISGE